MSANHSSNNTSSLSPLLSEIMRYVSELDDSYKSIRFMLLGVYASNARWGFLLNPILKCFEGDIGNSRFIFYGSKYTELLLKLRSIGESVATIGGPKQLPLCLKFSVPFMSNVSAWGPLANCLKGNSDEIKIKRIVDRFTVSLRGNPNRYLILDNDSVPMQRLLSIAASVAGIQTIYIQDGLFQNASSDKLIIGRRADYVFAYDIAQANVFMQKGVAKERIRVLGFYSDNHKRDLPPLREGSTRKVCFLGQPWASYSDDIANVYINQTMNLLMEMRDAGVEVCFKPHPGERSMAYLHQLSQYATVINSTLNKALEDFDVFLSFSSTALYEATLHRRIAIQIWDPVFKCDRFDSLGYAYTIPLDSSDLHMALQSIITKMSPLELNQPAGNIASRFMSCLQ